MPTLTFKMADALRVAKHSIAAPTQRPIAYTDTPVSKPAVLLVHDTGVYLMSNGTPRDLISGDQETGSSFVAYAKGCNKDTDPDWWETSRALVGGDDFGETLEGWAEPIVKAAERGATAVRIKLGKRNILLSFLYPAPKAPVKWQEKSKV